ncbi:MAG TPA: glutathionylspermidine synthase family protein [Bacillus sp. (in: firmicutes)]|uniref:glutathionylspermidine synthase family protein n=1 Tax=Bacillus litorisediminis TaxID=2922713 RepID=UPI001FACB268|nr:glutathionylspermidine synthase family protein [Bacillus litorisediminis]HWO76757.1 glutathionylspermidine synthase family protein [Bacillus sp. (in: firmicutes)]
MDKSAHQIDRDLFYKKIPHFWYDLYGTEYALYDIKRVSSSFIKEVRHAAECVGNIFWKTNQLVSQLDDKVLEQLGFPNKLIPYLKTPSLDEQCVIGRLDFAVSNNQIKLLEFNADTPTFIKETFYINELICNHFQCKNPNHAEEEKLQKAIRRAIALAWRNLGRSGDPKVVFTSHGDHEEDLWTTKYLMELSGIAAEYVSLEDLLILEHSSLKDGREEGIYTPEGERIDVLYRQTYPLEHLIEDRDPESGTPVGTIFLAFIKQKKLAMINPISAFLMQSKAIQALIWGLHSRNHPFYSSQEHDIINTYFLPTYLDPDPFQAKGEAYVKKPSFGREGDTVEIWNQHGEKWMEDNNKTYDDSLPVYQKFVPLMDSIVQTIQGKKPVKIMFGCFLVNGKPSSIGIRAGGQITDNASYYLPIGLE